MSTTASTGAPRAPQLGWLAAVVQLTITPVFLGALVLGLDPQRSARDGAAGVGLALLGAIHLLYWARPWPAHPRRAVVAAAGMVLTNVVLVDGLALAEPLLWLYPALVVGAGLRPPLAAGGVGLLALAAGGAGAITSPPLIHLLGPDHAIPLAVALAGLGMTAVRQLVRVNTDLHASKAALAELAVAAERERLARELHDGLGRTLALIAVKAELAGRLRPGGDPAAAEMRDVQGLARAAIREVRGAVAGDHVLSVAAELAAIPGALRTAGIAAHIDAAPGAIAPAHEATVAGALREAVTNVVKHSGARTCRIALHAADGVTTLEVVDDGRGLGGDDAGTGLTGLAARVHALDGTVEAGPGAAGGFRLRVQLGAPAPLGPPPGGAR